MSRAVANSERPPRAVPPRRQPQVDGARRAATQKGHDAPPHDAYAAVRSGLDDRGAGCPAGRNGRPHDAASRMWHDATGCGTMPLSLLPVGRPFRRPGRDPRSGRPLTRGGSRSRERSDQPGSEATCCLSSAAGGVGLAVRRRLCAGRIISLDLTRRLLPRPRWGGPRGRPARALSGD